MATRGWTKNRLSDIEYGFETFPNRYGELSQGGAAHPWRAIE
jgi:hypothetical protein